MMRKIKILNHNAVSLIEVLLSAVIFVIAVAGIFYTMTSVRYPVTNGETSLSAAIFGKQILESLNSQEGAGANAYYVQSCTSPNADASCGDFSLYMGLHEVSSSTLSTVTGLSWPTTLTSSNTCGAISPCLSYNVTCGDGNNSTPPNCSSASVAKRVDLNINWPSSP